MKNNFWKKTAAGLLALLIVAGATPAAPFSKTFERTAITANADDIPEFLKPYADGGKALEIGDMINYLNTETYENAKYTVYLDNNRYDNTFLVAVLEGGSLEITYDGQHNEAPHSENGTWFAEYKDGALYISWVEPPVEIASGNCGKSTNEGGEESVKWSLDDKGTLTISGKGDMEDYTGAKPWANYFDKIKTVVIEDGVTSIGNKSFYNYKTLTSVTIPPSVKRIGDEAFDACSLQSLTIPDSVTTIGDGAFYSCNTLESVTIPASVTSIDKWAFYGCMELKSISLKRATPPTLGEHQFYYSKEYNINTDLKIYVPVSSVDAYKEADNWSNYADTFTGQFYEVKLSDITGGTITADDCFIDKDAEDKTVTLTVTPDTGYSVKTVKYNDGTDHTIEPVNGVYSFTMPEADVTVSAEFEHTLHSINVDDSVSHGSVSAAVGETQDAKTAYYGDDVTLTVEPDEGYHLAENSLEVETVGTMSVAVTPHENTTTNTVYTFTMPDDSVDVNAEFVANEYTVVFDKNSEDARGTMDNQSFTYDGTGNLSLNSYRRTGYSFAGWATSADGEVEYEDGEAVRNLTSVDGGTITLYAKWTQNSYGIYIPDLEHGSVSADKNRAHYGDDVTLTVEPDEGYQLKGNTLKISANSTSVNVTPHENTCTVAMPAGYTSVYAEFEKIPVGVKYIDENGEEKSVNAIPLDGTETELDAGWYVVNEDITYEPGNASFELSGDVKIIIEDGKKLSFGKKTDPKYGISGGTLSVYGQTNGTGTMNVYANANNPVSLIGLNIYGGTLNVVTASSGYVKYAIEANNIVFKNCTVNAEYEGHNAINIATNGKLTIDNADVTSKGGIYAKKDGAELIVSNSTVNVSSANTAISFYAINLINSKVETSVQSFDIQAYVVNIDGGEFTGKSTEGISAYQVNIGMKTADDFVLIKSYKRVGSIVIAENQILTDGKNDYDGKLTVDEQTAIEGKKLTPKTCTVTWKNEDGTILETDENVIFGTEPHYDGATPAKAGDAQYSYSFKGWYKQVSETTGDVTYTAQFDREVNKYTVTWKNADGTILEIDKDVEYGTEPHYDGATPTKPSNTDYYYTFEGWGPKISSVTGNVTYTATFSSHYNLYPQTWTLTMDDYTFDGTAHTPTINGTAYTYPNTRVKYTYYNTDTDEELNGAPSAVGNYKVEVYADGGQHHYNRTQTVTYSILSPINDNGMADVEVFKKNNIIPEAEGKTFAGWFTDSTCTTPYTSDSGEAYAKFVDNKVLTVKAQISNGTTKNSAKTSIRFITSLDSLDYKNVGLKVTFNGNTIDKPFTKVYSSLIANGKKVDPSVFSKESHYLGAYTIKNIPNSAFYSNFKVTPYYTTQDGTVVEGTPNTFTIANMIK